jgi:hypothetical protein
MIGIWSAVIFLLASYIKSLYSFSSIRGRFEGGKFGWQWHLLQWFENLLQLTAGIMFGMWAVDIDQEPFNFGRFGIIITIAIQGIPIYVLNLRYLLKKYYLRNNGGVFN